MSDIKTVPNTDLRPGMFLVDGDQRLGINSVAALSSKMNNELVYVETDFGTLYLDNDGESSVVIAW